MDATQVEQFVNKRMKETADVVEMALTDIKKNLATKKEVIGLISERTKDDRDMLTAT